MHAERTTLPDQAVEQQRDLLRDLVVFDEELLKLVDDQQDARHGHLGPGLAVAGQVLAAQLAEDLAALLELDVEPLEHAQAELALALDGDDPGVGQLHRGVDLELDAFLEVDQVELELVGAVPQGHVGDQGVQQGRFARAGLAGDQDVLRRALAELQVLELGRAGAAQGDVDALAAVEAPVLVGLGRDELERHLDAVGVAGGVADVVEQLGEPRLVGRRVETRVETGRNSAPATGSLPSFQIMLTQGCSRSLSWKPDGRLSFVSSKISV